jgi:hypothetical protein
MKIRLFGFVLMICGFVAFGWQGHLERASGAISIEPRPPANPVLLFLGGGAVAAGAVLLAVGQGANNEEAAERDPAAKRRD